MTAEKPKPKQFKADRQQMIVVANNRANVNNKCILTAILSQPRTDGIYSSKMVNRLLQSLFAARKLNDIIIYISHYKIFKKERKLELYAIKK